MPTLRGPIPLWGSNPPQIHVGALKSYHIQCIYRGRAGPVAIGLNLYFIHYGDTAVQINAHFQLDSHNELFS